MDETSRYLKTRTIENDGVTSLYLRDIKNFNVDKATYYTVKYRDTLDKIAYREYGVSELWWAILDANPQYSSEIEVTEGDILLIPPFEEVVKFYA